MKLKCISLFLLLVVACMSYAHESVYTLIGKNCSEERPVFILEVTEDIGENIQINENGEVYIKVDQVVVVPQTSLCQEGIGFMNPRSLEDLTSCGSRASAPPTRAPSTRRA